MNFIQKLKIKKSKETEIGELSEDWIKTSLREIIDIKHGYAFKGEYFTDDENDNVLLTPGNFNIGGGFKSDKFKFYNGEVPEEYVLNEGDIIITMTDLSKSGDTLGYSAKVPNISKKRLLHNQRLGKVILELNSQIDRDFLYWLLRTREYRNHVLATASGTTVKHTSPTRILDYSFNCPPLPEQRAIASILGSLDDKIALNRQMNSTLEAIGQALFRRWFVDFEFPDGEGKPYRSSGGEMVETELGEVPRGWKVMTVGEIIELAYGKPLKDENRLKGNVPVYGSNGQIGWHNEKLVEGPGIVVGRKGNPGIVTWSHKAFFPIDTTFYVVLKAIQSMYYLFYILRLQDLQSLGADSAVPGLNRNVVYMNKMIVPSSEILEIFDTFLGKIYNKVQNNNEQSDILAEIRDALLPKLMSGEIRLK